jgi:hypothetical protein
MGKLYQILLFIQFLTVLPSLHLYSLTSVSVSVYYGGFGSECSWEIREKCSNQLMLSGTPGSDNAFSYNGFLNLPGGVFVFRAFDSAGNGWTLSNGWFQVTPLNGEGTSQVFFANGYEKESEFVVFTNSGADIGIVEMLSPQTAPGLSNSTPVSLRIRNFGNVTLTNFSVYYSVNGGSQNQNSYTTSIQPGQSFDVIFEDPANLATIGIYNFTFFISGSNDQYSLNNSYSESIQSQYFVSLFPFQENFTIWPPAQWQYQLGSQSWQWSSLGYAFCNFFFWMPGSKAFLNLPPVFVNQALFLSFEWARALNALPDSIKVQASNDNGFTWNTLWQKSGSQLFTSGGSNNSPGQFINQNIDLSQFINQYVLLRFVGISNFGSNFYLDQVSINPYPPTDVAINQLITPTLNYCTAGLQPITIQVKNLGANPVNTLIASYSVSSDPTVFIDTFSVNLSFNDEANLTFSDSYFFESGLQVSLNLSIYNPGDVNPLNDILLQTFFVTESISTFPYTEDFVNGISSNFELESGAKAKTGIVTLSGSQMLRFEGDSLGVGWSGTASGTTSAQAWNQNIAFISNAATCMVDATSLTSLQLKFKLKQTYVYGNHYSWFRVLVNGLPVSDIFGNQEYNPIASTSDAMLTHTYDLTAYAGTVFELKFQGSNKWDSISRPPGNCTYIDDILLRPVPSPDLAVEQIITAVSSCNILQASPLEVKIKNQGGYSVQGYSIFYQVNNGPIVSIEQNNMLWPDSTINFTFPLPPDLSADGLYQITVGINYQGDSNPMNNYQSQTIENFEPADVVLISPSVVCENQAPIQLVASPPGGSFSGIGVINGFFDVSLVSLGTSGIHYEAIDENQCFTVSDIAIEVVENPLPEIGPDVTLNYWDTLNISPTVTYSQYLWSDGTSADTLSVCGIWNGAGNFNFVLTVSDSNGCLGTDTVQIEILNNAFQSISIPQNWSILSFYVIPFNQSVSQVFAPVLSSVFIVKDINGKVFWPIFGINTIGDMILGRGYQAKFSSSQVLNVYGIPVNPQEHPVLINSGWNIIGYLRQNQGAVATIFSPYISSIIIMKDGNGNIFWPALNVNSIVNMQPGRGYQIKAASGFSLLYPPN